MESRHLPLIDAVTSLSIQGLKAGVRWVGLHSSAVHCYIQSNTQSPTSIIYNVGVNRYIYHPDSHTGNHEDGPVSLVYGPASDWSARRCLSIRILSSQVICRPSARVKNVY